MMQLYITKNIGKIYSVVQVSHWR